MLAVAAVIATARWLFPTAGGRRRGRGRHRWIAAQAGGRAAACQLADILGVGWGGGLFFDRVSNDVIEACHRLCYFEFFGLVVVCLLTYD